jgi:glycosyltransferase involved in cell wall biosynthesis
MVIATRVPSFAVLHHNKVTWLVHQLRTAYDLRDTEFSSFDDSSKDLQLVEIIRRIDTQALSESRRLFSISDNVSQRLAEFNRLQAETLHPPPKHDGRYYAEGYGDYVLVVSRLNRLKRVDQIIRAMPYTRSNVKLYVVGRGAEGGNLQRLVERLDIAHRVRFLGFVPDQDLLRLYAGALAVFYAPYDEDYGFVTIEAFRSRKPMVSTLDAGGVLEFITDGQNGYILPPHRPQLLAARIDRLYGDRALCRRLGEAGYESVRSVTWERTIQTLLS